MAACDPLSYSNVDSTKWQCARDVVRRKYGINIESDQGEEGKNGFRFAWNYNSANQTLQIQCVKRLFLVPCGPVNQRIKDAAAECHIA